MANKQPSPDMAWVAKSFERRGEAALQKRHLPSCEDLIYGMPFYGGQLEADVMEFANRSEAVAGSLGLTELQVALIELSMSVSLEAVEDLASKFSPEQGPTRRRKFLDSLMLRRRIYLAAWGQTGPLANLAMETLNVALTYPAGASYGPEVYLHLLFRSLELLASAAGSMPFQPYFPGNRLWSYSDDPDKLLLQNRGIRRRASRFIIDEDFKDSQPSPSTEESLSSPARPNPTDEADGNSIVVLRQVGNADTSEGKIAATSARSITGRPLQLLVGKGLVSACNSLASEFPHAGELISALMNSFSEGRPVRMRPTILVGAPGSGKSRFCIRLMEEIGVPFTMVPMAGMADSAIIGTARRYSTGEASSPVSAIMDHQVANPTLILDEVDKAGAGNQNGNPIQSLLPMLEPVTAAAYYDPYLQAPIDISHINWIMTANSLASLGRPFRDRCRVIKFPAPKIEYLRTYVSNLLPRLAAERGQPVEMFQLDELQMRSLDNWTDGSMRTLKKMLEVMLDDYEISGRRRAN